MNTADYKSLVDALPYGKRLPGAVYLLDPGEASGILPSKLRVTVGELRRRLEIATEFNLLKFHTASPKISFLAYPSFEKDPHPPLHESIIVDLISGKVRRDDYRGRENPPILHRKETFLPADHPLHPKFARLTREEEKAGLLEETSRIGFRLNWERLLADRGLAFKGHRLVAATTAPATAKPTAPRIHRHKTALVRREISKPVKTLLELGQLRYGESFFDYGCGHGGDVEAITKLGHASNGWDPVHASDRPKVAADVVNLGFVLNVIEDPAERVDALVDAWKHARRLLLVSTLIAGQEAYDDIQTYGDGVLTRRNTFQKFFDPAEIQSLLEDSLQAEAVPVGLGIYLVFRHTADLHDFLASRSRRFIDWVIVGGESGAGLRLTRPFALEWAEELREHCHKHSVAFFLKQLGRNPSRNGEVFRLKDPHGGEWEEWKEPLRIREFPAAFHAYRKDEMVPSDEQRPDSKPKNKAEEPEDHSITPEDRAEFKRQHKIVETGVKAFWRVGLALAVIKEKNLWRAGGHKSWDAYCRSVAGMSRGHAHRLMGAAGFMEMLKTSPRGDVLPMTEAQVRPLLRLPDPEQQMDVWCTAVERVDGGQPSQPLVMQLVLEKKNPDGPVEKPASRAQQRLDLVVKLKAVIAKRSSWEDVEKLLVELETLV